MPHIPNPFQSCTYSFPSNRVRTRWYFRLLSYTLVFSFAFTRRLYSPVPYHFKTLYPCVKVLHSQPLQMVASSCLCETEERGLVMVVMRETEVVVVVVVVVVAIKPRPFHHHHHQVLLGWHRPPSSRHSKAWPASAAAAGTGGDDVKCGRRRRSRSACATTCDAGRGRGRGPRRRRWEWTRRGRRQAERPAAPCGCRG